MGQKLWISLDFDFKRRFFHNQANITSIIRVLKSFAKACKSKECSDGSRSKIFDPGRVSNPWFEFGFGKFPLKMSNFSIFFPLGQIKSLGVGSKSTRVKGRSASYLLLVKIKLGSGQGPSLKEWHLKVDFFSTLHKTTRDSQVK